MGRGAENLLERMRASAAGWKQADINRLLNGFRFRCRSGSRHDIFEHEDHPDLTISVPRHRNLRNWIIKDAVQLIDTLIDRQGGGEDGEDS